jgi:glycosyltransferase involved in cell wall biosynthesis
MITDKLHFDKITLLVTHYNRSKSLERLLSTFEATNCTFFDIVVSDDGSKPEHVDYIRSLHDKYNFTLVTAVKNGGLGSNINKGQDAIKSEYTLYVQEDFIPLPGFEKPIIDALKILEEDKEADTVRFYSYLDYPHLQPFRDGFSRMVFNPLSANIDKFPMYSDHPHLRRSNFFTKFGRYAEGKNPEKTEFDMMMSYLQHKGKGYLYTDYKSVFDQINTSAEPSTMNNSRKSWRRREGVLMDVARNLYRQVLCNYSLFFKKYKY